jgi:hypothetical protein
MARLSETARRLLERAPRYGGLIIPPPRSARELGVAETLLRRGLVRETRTSPEHQIEWRRDEEGISWALILTDAGWAAIGWNPPREASRERDQDWVIAEKLVAIFTEVHGREPRDFAEFEAYIPIGGSRRGTGETLVERFQNSNHMGPSKVPQSVGRSLKLRLSGFMESVV